VPPPRSMKDPRKRCLQQEPCQRRETTILEPRREKLKPGAALKGARIYPPKVAECLSRVFPRLAKSPAAWQYPTQGQNTGISRRAKLVRRMAAEVFCTPQSCERRQRADGWSGHLASNFTNCARLSALPVQIRPMAPTGWSRSTRPPKPGYRNI
jgi:hypothetical protein